MSDELGVDLPPGVGVDTPVFVISVAATLAGMHPQTLRQYDRIGLVSPGRSSGRGRRYSARDILVLREVARLSQQDGINLSGIKRILELEDQVDRLRQQVEALRSVVEPGRRVFAAGPGGDVVQVQRGQRVRREPTTSGALILWRPTQR